MVKYWKLKDIIVFKNSYNYLLSFFKITTINSYSGKQWNELDEEFIKIHKNIDLRLLYSLFWGFSTKTLLKRGFFLAQKTALEEESLYLCRLTIKRAAQWIIEGFKEEWLLSALICRSNATRQWYE